MSTRHPAVAGRFYPGNRHDLEAIVEACLTEAHKPETLGVPKAIIAPHAGFVFSGPIAGSAFATLQEAADSIDRVVLIGPSHYVGFRGVATSQFDVFETPLGPVPVDTDAVQGALHFDFVAPFEQAHAQEHSLETHLPFLQRALGDFRVVPIVTGRIARQDLAALLDTLWGGPETLISVSSDLSHFETADTARQLDARTSEAIVGFRPDQIGPTDACGAVAIRGLLETGGRRGLTSEVFDLRNSADTAGDPARVVGYGAYGFWAD